MSNIKDLLIVTDEDIAGARKHYQKSEIDIKQDVGVLKEWLRQQPHLPDDEDERRLESMFLKNKCRLEQTKWKLDRYYSFKLIYPEILNMYDVNSDNIQYARKSFIFVPLPKLTDKQERVFCVKIIDAEAFRGIDSFLYVCMLIELCHSYDYSLADIHLVDWQGITFNALKTFEVNTIRKYQEIATDALSGRIFRIQYINSPNFLNIFLRMAQLALKPKMFEKLQGSATVDELYSLVPKDILPIEFGGLEKSIYTLHDEWGKELQTQADLLQTLSKRISNEKLRIDKFEDSGLFGTDGSFKKLNLD